MRFLHSRGKLLGLAVPLLSVRTRKGPCGEFPDIPALARLAKSWDMGMVQLLPLNDTGFQTSPYSALSAFALNPIYLRIRDLPEAEDGLPGASPTDAGLAEDGQPDAGPDEAGAAYRRVGGGTKVPYEAILEKKLKILRSLWGRALEGAEGDALRARVDAWADGRPWARPYASFMVLKEENRFLPWWEWKSLRDPGPGELEGLWADPGFADKGRFFLWTQMRAQEQCEAAGREALSLGVDILGDIPILMNVDSADVWARRDIFDLSQVAGAPPDMYSSMGQNWGFPLYRWNILEDQGFGFWKERLACAARYYSAYRIDHVLGFFRIWAIGTREKDGFLGRFDPEYPIHFPDLASLGFDPARIRWLSLPHVPGAEVRDVLSALPRDFAARLEAALLSRIGTEDLFLFSPAVRGSADIADIIHAEARALFTPGAEPWEALRACEDFFCAAWRNRTLLEIPGGTYVPTWSYGETRAWRSLSEKERTALGALIARRKGESQGLWEKRGFNILKALSEGLDMQAFAEDLGAVPPCVPQVLDRLSMPGLRVLRWHRAWEAAGAPYVELSEYPENSMACTSVHDSSMLRQWWEEEADKEAVWALAGRALPEGEDPGPVPAELDPKSAACFLRAFAAAGSRIVAYPLQDILAASERYREKDPRDERINVPGTSGPENWTYRMKPYLEDLAGDGTFAAFAASLSGGFGKNDG